MTNIDMARLGAEIRSMIPTKGFVLLVMDVGTAGNVTSVTNVEKDSLLAAMKEYIALAEGRLMATPTHSH